MVPRRPSTERCGASDSDWIPNPHDPAFQDARADPAPARMTLLRDTREVVVQEIRADVFTRARELRDEQAHCADRDLDARGDGAPVDAGHRQVLARAPGRNRVAFTLQGSYHVE